jgi:hypothetical protein
VAFVLLEEALTPLNPIVEALLCRLDENLREAFEERAGIMTWEGGQPRELAEALAMLEVVRVHPFAVSGLVALSVRLVEVERTVLTFDRPAAERHIAALGGAVLGHAALAESIRNLGPVAILS